MILLKKLLLSELVELLRRVRVMPIVILLGARRDGAFGCIARRRRVESVRMIVRNEAILLLQFYVEQMTEIVHRAECRAGFHRVRRLDELGIRILIEFRIRVLPWDRLRVVLVVIDRGRLRDVLVSRSGNGGSVGREGRKC